MPTITPSGLTYGTVIGIFKTIEIDSFDEDLIPNHYPMRGTVRFTPSIRHSQYITEDGESATFYRTDITASLDKDGYLTSGAKSDPNAPLDTLDRGVRLLACDNPLLRPTGWTWSVSIQLESSTGAGVTNVPPFNITVNGNNNGPDSVDLSKVMPVASSPGYFSTIGPAGPTGPGVYVSPTNPNMLGPGVWVQTGLGDGSDFTLWIEDGQ